MEEKKDRMDLLDMMVQPVFCVKENIILRANEAAQQLFFTVGEDIRPCLDTCLPEYEAFSGGCLYLTLTMGGQRLGAAVRRIEDVDVFELDTGCDSAALQAMALAAGELRKPLSGALSNAAALLDTQEDPALRRQLSQLNRGLYHILRLLGNMTDAAYIRSQCNLETTDIPALIREIFEKAEALLSRSGVILSYQDLDASIYCLADPVQLERALLNLLSNAAKFTPRGGHITVSLTRQGRTLRLTVQDSGSGIAQEVMGSLFQRYLRQPGIEDSRFGLGLGIRMVHAAAAHHGGTLLITQGEGQGTRIVMTMTIRQNAQTCLRSPLLAPDYTGGFDHCLVELAECLPPELYDGSY